MKMKLFNSRVGYGWVSITLHWLMAVSLIAMYFLGDYMVDLEYYDAWYHQAPELHKEIGVVLGFLIMFRLLWNLLQRKPMPLDEDKKSMNFIAKTIHYVFYVLVISLVISGYLISTAKGQGIDVFGLFEFPALLSDNKDRGEIAGDIHELVALIFMILVALHALAALLHHFVLKDKTLKRMLTPPT